MPDFNSSPDAPKEGGKLPNVQLLWDCEMRWSSTFLMISRFLTLGGFKVEKFWPIIHPH